MLIFIVFLFHRLSRNLEETVIRSLSHFDVNGERSPINTGVWVNGNKVSAQGITASRWITMHGVSVNIFTDLSHYDAIVPCGIDRKLGGVCNLQQYVSKPLDVSSFTALWMNEFADVFSLRMVEVNEPQRRLQEMVDKNLELTQSKLETLCWV